MIICIQRGERRFLSNIIGKKPVDAFRWRNIIASISLYLLSYTFLNHYLQSYFGQAQFRLKLTLDSSSEHFRCFHGETERRPTAYFRVISDATMRRWKWSMLEPGLLIEGVVALRPAWSEKYVRRNDALFVQQPSQFASFNPFASATNIHSIPMAFLCRNYNQPTTINLL